MSITTGQTIPSPCYGCEKRHMRCHSECADYAEYTRLTTALREERRARADCARAISDVKRNIRNDSKGRRKGDDR